MSNNQYNILLTEEDLKVMDMLVQAYMQPYKRVVDFANTINSQIAPSDFQKTIEQGSLVPASEVEGD